MTKVLFGVTHRATKSVGDRVGKAGNAQISTVIKINKKFEEKTRAPVKGQVWTKEAEVEMFVGRKKKFRIQTLNSKEGLRETERETQELPESKNSNGTKS